MIFSWIRNQRRMQLLVERFPRGCASVLRDNVRHYEHLDRPRRRPSGWSKSSWPRRVWLAAQEST